MRFLKKHKQIFNHSYLSPIKTWFHRVVPYFNKSEYLLCAKFGLNAQVVPEKSKMEKSSRTERRTQEKQIWAFKLRWAKILLPTNNFWVGTELNRIILWLILSTIWLWTKSRPKHVAGGGGGGTGMAGGACPSSFIKDHVKHLNSK